MTKFTCPICRLRREGTPIASAKWGMDVCWHCDRRDFSRPRGRHLTYQPRPPKADPYLDRYGYDAYVAKFVRQGGKCAHCHKPFRVMHIVPTRYKSHILKLLCAHCLRWWTKKVPVVATPRPKVADSLRLALSMVPKWQRILIANNLPPEVLYGLEEKTYEQT